MPLRATGSRKNVSRFACQCCPAWPHPRTTNRFCRAGTTNQERAVQKKVRPISPQILEMGPCSTVSSRAMKPTSMSSVMRFSTACASPLRLRFLKKWISQCVDCMQGTVAQLVNLAVHRAESQHEHRATNSSGRLQLSEAALPPPRWRTFSNSMDASRKQASTAAIVNVGISRNPGSGWAPPPPAMAAAQGPGR